LVASVALHGIPAHQPWLEALERVEMRETLFAQFEAVRKAMRATGYPEENIHLIKGKVEDTIPGQAPKTVALLRLDTDWYASTWHELAHLYPRLARGGVLMIADYAQWQRTRKATDQYFAEHEIAMLLHRVDDQGCRIGIKR